MWIILVIGKIMLRDLIPWLHLAVSGLLYWIQISVLCTDNRIELSDSGAICTYGSQLSSEFKRPEIAQKSIWPVNIISYPAVVHRRTDYHGEVYGQVMQEPWLFFLILPMEWGSV